MIGLTILPDIKPSLIMTLRCGVKAENPNL